MKKLIEKFKQSNKLQRILIISAGSLIVFVLYASVISPSASAEEKADKKVATTKGTGDKSILEDTLSVSKTNLDYQTTGEQGKKEREFNDQNREFRTQTGNSHIDLLNNPTEDYQAGQENKENTVNLVDLPPEDPPLPANNGANTQAVTVPTSEPTLDPNALNSKPVVYEVEIIKEVPVPERKPYQFKNDLSVLTHFAKEYGLDAEQGQNQHQQGQGQSNARTTRTKFGIATPAVASPTAQAQALPNAPAQVPVPTPVEKQQVALAKRGEMMFASLQSQLNSDHPSMVLATISDGKYRGGILVGKFEINQGDGKSLVVKFDTLNLPQANQSIPIDAWAYSLDKETTALVSKVDNHYFARLVFPTLQALATNFSSNLAHNNQHSTQKSVVDTATGKASTVNETTITKKSNKEILHEGLANGVATATQEIGTFIPKNPTIKVNRNTDIAIIFNQDVLIDTDKAQQWDLDTENY